MANKLFTTQLRQFIHKSLHRLPVKNAHIQMIKMRTTRSRKPQRQSNILGNVCYKVNAKYEHNNTNNHKNNSSRSNKEISSLLVAPHWTDCTTKIHVLKREAFVFRIFLLNSRERSLLFFFCEVRDSIKEILRATKNVCLYVNDMKNVQLLKKKMSCLKNTILKMCEGCQLKTLCSSLQINVWFGW